MTQYFKIKEANPDTILLFRVGDFFETFEEDAKTASKVLGIIDAILHHKYSGLQANL